MEQAREEKNKIREESNSVEKREISSIEITVTVLAVPPASKERLDLTRLDSTLIRL